MREESENAQLLAYLMERKSLSVQLPAGTGKTETIAALVRDFSKRGLRSLVLTHTHAGVDALKARVHRKYSVARESCRIRTIAGWAFELIRGYPMLSGYQVPALPDYRESDRYYLACTQVLRSDAIREILAACYDIVIVDEYQDCVTAQHQVILALRDSVPTIVFGDPLQSLFHFNGNVPVDWSKDVIPVFIPVSLDSFPWRWHNKNQELGDWLIEIRKPLSTGKPIDLRDTPVSWKKLPKAEWRARAYLDALNDVDNGGFAIAALGKWPRDVTRAAFMFGGRMQVMEEIEGKSMLRFAEELTNTPEDAKVSKTIDFAKSCAIGIARIVNSSKCRRIAEGKSVHTKDPRYKPLYSAINRATEEPSIPNLKNILDRFYEIEDVHVYCYEAWSEVSGAMDFVARDSSTGLSEAVAKRREILRHRGRRLGSRIVSRPLLVKGLEFDHVILLDAALYSREELYVALSRASRSVTVFGESPTILPTEERG